MSGTTLAPTTVGVLRRAVARQLAATSETATLDARILVAYVLGSAPTDLALRDEELVGDDLEARAMMLARRRAAGEPVARIVGEKEFYGLTLALGPETLEPRPDTETLVDAVLDTVVRDRPVTILDLGTGSGAILLALLSELPNAWGLGVDLSEAALAVARANAVTLGLGERAAFAAGDWSAAVGARFDVVAANPPYIEAAAICGLPVDVRDHDPHVALDGGEDGLFAYRRIFADLKRLLKEDGSAFLEIGAGQADAVAEIAAAARFQVSFRRDLAGIDRVAVAVRRQGLRAFG